MESRKIFVYNLVFPGSFPDHSFGEMLIADFILFTLNQQKAFKYVEVLKLEEPCDCITTVLTKGAINLNKMLQTRSTTGGKLIFITIHGFLIST